MKQGPPKVIHCRHCQSFNLKNAYLSWDNMGLEIWSGFRYFGKFFPDIHARVKCHYCQDLFWIEEQEEIGNYDHIDAAYSSAGFPLNPGIQDYQNALGTVVANSKDKKRYIRKWIWWGYNDQFRNGPLYKHKLTSVVKENLVRYTRLLDTSNQNDLLF